MTLPYGAGTRMLTLDQVCEWFQLPMKTVRGMVDRRSIPYRKVGQALRFPEAELEEWSRPKAKDGDVIALHIPVRQVPTRPRPRNGRTLRATYNP